MVIQAYDPDWITRFEKIKQEIHKNVPTGRRIHHIGSTSIPGMYAKPIIDVNIEIDSGADFEKTKLELGSIGYFHNGDQGIEGREVFKRNPAAHNAILDSIQHHLYVCVKGSREHERNILFRDYLREHEEFVEKYNRIKFEILGRCGEDNREAYVEIKEKEYRWFFEDVIRRQIEEKTEKKE